MVEDLGQSGGRDVVVEASAAAQRLVFVDACSDVLDEQGQGAGGGFGGVPLQR